MQKLRRYLSMMVALALAAGPLLVALTMLAIIPGSLAATLTMSSPMPATVMAQEMATAVAAGDVATDDCAPCTDRSGMMQDCLPSCTNPPAFVSEEATQFPSDAATYGSLLKLPFDGARGSPDPYPPRPNILI